MTDRLVPKPNALIVSHDGAVTGFKQGVVISSSDDLPGYRQTAVLGLVRGNAVRARHVGLDVMAALKNIVGGEINEYTRLLAQTREQAMDRMCEQALSIGANAIVSVRFTTSMVMAGAAELLAYGTAVTVEKA